MSRPTTMNATPDIVIRFARPGDEDLIHGFIRQLAKHEDSEHLVKTTPQEIGRALSAAAPPLRCLIAELDERPVGYAAFYVTFSTWTANGIHLEDLYVLPEHRGSGIGKLLFGELRRFAEAKGCGRIDWFVLGQNQAAPRFYREMGARQLLDWQPWRLDV